MEMISGGITLLRDIGMESDILLKELPHQEVFWHGSVGGQSGCITLTNITIQRWYATDSANLSFLNPVHSKEETYDRFAPDFINL